MSKFRPFTAPANLFVGCKRVDLVLGSAWFATLRPHIADYNALSIKYYLGDTLIILQKGQASDPTTTCTIQPH